MRVPVVIVVAALLLASGAGGLRAGEATDPALPPRALVRIGSDTLRTRTWVKAVAFSPDGRLIAAAQANSPTARAVLFDVATGREIKVITSPQPDGHWVESVAFSPDGKMLLWGEAGGMVALWNLADGRLLFRERVHAGEVAAVRFSPDGRKIATGGGHTVSLRHIDRPEVELRELVALPGGADRDGNGVGLARGIGVLDLAFSPDGSRLAAARADEAMLFVWDTRDGRLIHMLHARDGQPLATGYELGNLAFTPDGRRLMSAGVFRKPVTLDGRLVRGGDEATELVFRDVETGRRATSVVLDGPATGRAALAPDGGSVAVVQAGTICFVQTATGRVLRQVAVTRSGAATPVFSPDGRLVAWPTFNGVGLIDAQSGRLLLKDDRAHLGSPLAAAWSPAGNRLVTGHHDGIVRVWDAASGRLIWSQPVSERREPGDSIGFVGFLAWSSDDRRVIVAGTRGNPNLSGNVVVTVFDADRGEPVRTIERPGNLRHAALANEGRMIVIATTMGGNDDTRFIGIERETGKIRWSTPPESEQMGYGLVARMQFRPQSPLLEAAMDDGNVIRFNSLTGRELRRFVADWQAPGPNAGQRPMIHPMWNATFSADGRTLVTSQDQWLYVWDVETGKLLRKIEHPHRHHCQLALAADGRTLATSDVWYGGDYGDDVIRMYDIATGERTLELVPRDDRANVMVFSPDGTRLFTGLSRGSGIVWDVRPAGDRKRPSP